MRTLRPVEVNGFSRTPQPFPREAQEPRVTCALPAASPALCLLKALRTRGPGRVMRKSTEGGVLSTRQEADSAQSCRPHAVETPGAGVRGVQRLLDSVDHQGLVLRATERLSRALLCTGCGH